PAPRAVGPRDRGLDRTAPVRSAAGGLAVAGLAGPDDPALAASPLSSAAARAAAGGAGRRRAALSDGRREPAARSRPLARARLRRAALRGLLPERPAR